ncbi:MAG TPA: type II secretion system protein GspF, partial [Burkholderiales bacterium]|nr:type II secretion system protein GspF [Burkholderiales bacterium]
MASFRFEAADPAGRVEKGLIDADSARAARSSLRTRGLVPLAVDAVDAGGSSRPARFRARR